MSIQFILLNLVTMQLHHSGDVNTTLANASIYLEAFGHIVVSWIWLSQALCALESKHDDKDFYAGKLQACRWFFRYELPKVDTQLALLASLDTTTLTMQDNWF